VVEGSPTCSAFALRGNVASIVDWRIHHRHESAREQSTTTEVGGDRHREKADAVKSPDSASSTTLIAVRLRDFPLRRFEITVLSGPTEGKSVQSDGSEFTIGNDRANQLVLNDGTVSRHHCCITSAPNGFLLRDLGSKNGTKVSGLRVEGAYLKAGAIIEVGLSKLRFDILNEQLRAPLSDEDSFGSVFGQSASMRRLFAVLPRIAESDSTVLIEGETGTGKGLIAQAIHSSSARSKGPWIVVDCGSIPPSLIERELFGHEKGAFTGADSARPGVFEAAGGGTLFLDEIGELPLEMQPKLLRALEERSIRRIGSVAAVRLDVRLMAATNRDLRKLVNAGTFRSDLYYRLKIATIHVPPLRERVEDIPLLAAHFYKQLTGDDDVPPDLLESLARRDWPGNVRELKNAIERTVLMGTATFGASIPPAPDAAEHIGGLPTEATLTFREAKERAISGWERGFLERLLRRTSGNVSRAAREAKMDRNYLRELVRRYGLVDRGD
jgi:DNA-binding NtrC family response regulator